MVGHGRRIFSIARSASSLMRWRSIWYSASAFPRSSGSNVVFMASRNRISSSARRDDVTRRASAIASFCAGVRLLPSVPASLSSALPLHPSSNAVFGFVLGALHRSPGLPHL